MLFVGIYKKILVAGSNPSEVRTMKRFACSSLTSRAILSVGQMIKATSLIVSYHSTRVLVEEISLKSASKRSNRSYRPRNIGSRSTALVSELLRVLKYLVLNRTKEIITKLVKIFVSIQIVNPTIGRPTNIPNIVSITPYRAAKLTSINRCLITAYASIATNAITNTS